MDNRYYKYGCPALMQDKRFITNYLQRRTYDQIIKNINNIDSAQNYRLFLQQNGDKILNNERALMQKIYTCNISGKCVSLDGTAKCDNSCGC